MALARHGVTVVGEIAGPEDAIPIVVEREPAMLVVELTAETDDPNLRLRNENVLAFVRAARDRVPALRVIAVTESLDVGLVANAVSRGVDAYVLESDDF